MGFPYLVIALFLAVPQEVHEETDPDGTVRARYQWTAGEDGARLRHGSCTLFHASGERAAQGRYRRGLRTGTWKFWREDGSVLEEGKYRDGVRYGKWRVWHEDGATDEGLSGTYQVAEKTYPGSRQRRYAGSVRNGQRHGEWYFWWESGAVKAEGGYDAGQRHGDWKFWHPDGTFDPEVVSGQYRDGTRTGPLQRKVSDRRAPDAAFRTVELGEIPGDVHEWLLTALDSPQGPEVRDGDPVAFHRQAFPFVLAQIQALDLEDPAGAREAATLHDRVLKAIFYGHTYGWRPSHSAGDAQANRRALRRWEVLAALLKGNENWWPVDRRLGTSQTLFQPPVDPVENSFATRPLTAELQYCVEQARDWLRRHQDPHGFWDCDNFGARCRSNQCNGQGRDDLDVGVTALATHALLEGNASDRQAAARAILWLLDKRDPRTGAIGGTHRQWDQLSHAVATRTLCHAAWTLESPVVREAAQEAVVHIQRSRNPYKAWRYQYPPDGDNDLVMSAWMLEALFAGQAIGLQVEQDAFQEAMGFIDELTDPATWRTGYQERGSFGSRYDAGDHARWPAEKRESNTAQALVVRILHGESPNTSQAIRGGADLLVQKPPVWDEREGSVDFVYWYFGTRALRQVGGRAWDQWQKKVRIVTVHDQRQDGDERGSWDPQPDPWGAWGGRVYATAMNALTCTATGGEPHLGK